MSRLNSLEINLNYSLQINHSNPSFSSKLTSCSFQLGFLVYAKNLSSLYSASILVRQSLSLSFSSLFPHVFVHVAVFFLSPNLCLSSSFFHLFFYLSVSFSLCSTLSLSRSLRSDLSLSRSPRRALSLSCSNRRALSLSLSPRRAIPPLLSLFSVIGLPSSLVRFQSSLFFSVPFPSPFVPSYFIRSSFLKKLIFQSHL